MRIINKENKMRAIIMTMIFLGFVIAALSGCETLNVTKPIMPIEEYEKMIMGRIGPRLCNVQTLP